MRRERNQIQDELEIASSQLQQERQETQRLEQALAAALAAPKSHQKKAYSSGVNGVMTTLTCRDRYAKPCRPPIYYRFERRYKQ